jgi:ABC-type nitrate/sulfonate/bicarbonate transport system permease component
MKPRSYPLIGVLVLCIGWSFVSFAHIVDPFFLPDPFTTARVLTRLIAQGFILQDMIATLVRVFLAFGIAIAIGLPLGLLLGRLERVYRSLEFLIDFFRSTPATALFPLFLLLFGVSDTSKISVAAFSSALIIIFNSAYGVIHGKKSRIFAARLMGASRWQIFRYIIFWESLPQTVIGLRNAVSLALVVVVVTEMFIGTNAGLGRRIIDAQITYNIAEMYAVILLTGIIGYIFNSLFVLMERRLLQWSGQ